MKMQKIVPMLPVSDIKGSLSFYKDILGFEVKSYNDQWNWASISMDGCDIMLDESICSDRNAGNVVYLYPDNLDEFHERIKKAGYSVPDIDVTFYGMREFRIRDPHGNWLWIGISDNPE